MRVKLIGVSNARASAIGDRVKHRFLLQSQEKFRNDDLNRTDAGLSVELTFIDNASRFVWIYPLHV